jgi:hypothetical protein
MPCPFFAMLHLFVAMLHLSWTVLDKTSLTLCFA